MVNRYLLTMAPTNVIISLTYLYFQPSPQIASRWSANFRLLWVSFSRTEWLFLNGGRTLSRQNIFSPSPEVISRFYHTLFSWWRHSTDVCRTRRRLIWSPRVHWSLMSPADNTSSLPTGCSASPVHHTWPSGLLCCGPYGMECVAWRRPRSGAGIKY